ncbi:hypothetical protein C8R46DRAFT_333212 [Mycena filopes]|nr:hypothetical protein C8R46DRAFT_333212 [Mycena filopes]
MSAAASVINLSPASAGFVAARTTTLGPWVLGAFLDCGLMGVIFCQTSTFFRTRSGVSSTLAEYYKWLVVVIVGLSMLKTAQCIAVVWVQNVLDFANPDVARLLVAKAWYQVSMPLMTGIIGVIVQSFFCLRFYMLSRNWMFCVPIIAAMCLALAGVCLSLASILAGNAKAKVMWLLVHLVSVFIADLLICGGTIYSLRQHNTGLTRTTALVNRLLRLVFESALPPAVIATIDLIMTQTLGKNLLWHLFINMALGKIYVVSLLYTLNTINEHRVREQSSQEVYSYPHGRGSRGPRTNLELTPRGIGPGGKDQIFVQTQVATHISPSTFSPTGDQQHLSDKEDYFSTGEETSSTDRARFAQ